MPKVHKYSQSKVIREKKKQKNRTVSTFPNSNNFLHHNKVISVVNLYGEVNM